MISKLLRNHYSWIVLEMGKVEKMGNLFRHLDWLFAMRCGGFGHKPIV
jgi:hypothetical protein